MKNKGIVKAGFLLLNLPDCRKISRFCQNINLVLDISIEPPVLS